MEQASVEFSVFGRIEALVGGRPADLGGPMQRAVLAMLLVHANRVVPTERLIDDVWNGEPPPTAATALQVYVANLRRVLEPGRAARTPPSVLLTQPPGYRLVVDPRAFDVPRFESLVREGRELLASRRVAQARDVLSAALALSRDAPYGEFATDAWIVPEITRLGELRAGVADDLAETRLALGEDAVAVSELEQLVAAEPLRERRWELLALALYRTGRQADALRAIGQVRTILADEVGLDPRPSLKALETDILNQAASLERRDATDGGEPDDSYLEVWSEGGRQVVVLGVDRLTIGRSSSSGLQIADALVSRNHAVVERTDAGWSVRDTGSANGTVLNGLAVGPEPRPLQPGDAIGVGGARLFFRSRAADAAAETVRPDPAARGR